MSEDFTVAKVGDNDGFADLISVHGLTCVF
jgi:hypothetical protein